MSQDVDKPNPLATFGEGLAQSGDYLLHHFAHGVEIVGKAEAHELLAVGEVGMQVGEAAVAAWHHDWKEVAEHSAGMANSAANFLSGGVLGVAEAGYNAGALVGQLHGKDVPTAEQNIHTGLWEAGEHIGDKIADAREATQIWGEKTLHELGKIGEHIGDKIADAREVAQIWGEKTLHEPRTHEAGGRPGEVSDAAAIHHALHTTLNSGAGSHGSGLSVPQLSSVVGGEGHISHEPHHAAHHGSHPHSHENRIHAPFYVNEGHGLSLSSDSHAHHGAHQHHHTGGSGASEHVAHNPGHGPDVNTMHISIHDVLQWEANHQAGHGSGDKGLPLPIDISQPVNQDTNFPHHGHAGPEPHVYGHGANGQFQGNGLHDAHGGFAMHAASDNDEHHANNHSHSAHDDDHGLSAHNIGHHQDHHGSHDGLSLHGDGHSRGQHGGHDAHSLQGNGHNQGEHGNHHGPGSQGDTHHQGLHNSGHSSGLHDGHGLHGDGHSHF